MYRIEQFDLSLLPESAQNELYDFYLFLRQRYAQEKKKAPVPEPRIDEIFPRKLANIKPFTRDEIYE